MDIVLKTSQVPYNGKVLTGDGYKIHLLEFRKNLEGLLSFLQTLNTFVGENQGTPPPVSPLILSLGKSGFSAFGDPVVELIMKNFIERAGPHSEHLSNRNVKAFVELAPSLFPELPKPIIECVTQVVENDCIPEESISDVFDYMDSLILSALRYTCTKANSDVSFCASLDSSDFPELFKKLYDVYPALSCPN